jgi:hypothetical protein
MIIEARRYFDVYLGFWVWSAVAAWDCHEPSRSLDNGHRVEADLKCLENCGDRGNAGPEELATEFPDNKTTAKLYLSVSVVINIRKEKGRSKDTTAHPAQIHSSVVNSVGLLCSSYAVSLRRWEWLLSCS